MKNLIQFLKILDLLSRPQGTTLKEIAKELKITERSAYRDIKTIEELGIPIYDEKIPLEKQKRWHIESSYVDRLPNLTLPKISLSFSEIISLCMMAGESVVFKGTVLDRYIQTALSKLIYFLPEETQRGLSGLRRIFISKTIGSKTYVGKETIIQTLTESILNHTICKITYHSFYSDEIKDEKIGPLHFFEKDGGLYLFAVKLSEKEVYTYAIERIKQITPLSDEVIYPKTFDPEARLNSAFDQIGNDPVTVKIHFSKTVARYINERQWASIQKIENHPDGSITLSMTTSGQRDVKRWVMSYGKEAQLLEPEKMRMEIINELEEILKKMKKNESTMT